MTYTVLAVYKRESTLWKNANAFYRSQDWVTMECGKYDYSEELKSIEEDGTKWIDLNGVDVTDREIERRFGRPYCITFKTKYGTNSKTFSFKTADEANEFFKSVMKDKILGNFKKVK